MDDDIVAHSADVLEPTFHSSGSAASTTDPLSTLQVRLNL